MGKHGQARKKANKRKPQKNTKKNRASTPQRNVPAKRTASHYDALRVPRDADAETIRASYLALVKEFPPETHPDQFETIRVAYEVLKDPESRRQYDRERFYGASLTTLRDRARALMDRDRIQDAVDVWRQVVDIRPTAADYLSLARGYDALEQRTTALAMFDKALEYAEGEAQEVEILIQRAHGAGSSDQQIVEELIAIGDAYSIEVRRAIANDVFVHYENMGQASQGIAYYLQLIPRKTYLTADEFHLYLELLSLVQDQAGMEAEFRKILRRAKAAAQRAATGPYRDAIMEDMLRTVEKASDEGINLQLGKAYIQLAQAIQPENQEIPQMLDVAEGETALEFEMARMIARMDLPSDLVMRVFQSYIAEFDAGLFPGGLLNELSALARQISEPLDRAEAVETVEMMKKTYPRLYRKYGAEISKWQQESETPNPRRRKTLSWP